MSRLVFDTNVILSALLFEGSKPSKAFEIGLKHHVILFSLSTLTELEEVLWRNKFDQYLSYEERKQFLTGFILQSTPIETDETISICRDPKDNKFLELAVCGKADFVISGDEDLLILSPFHNIQILTPDSFIRLHSAPASSWPICVLLRSSAVPHKIKWIKRARPKSLQGTTETTFYVLAVYFGAVQVRRLRHALLCAHEIGEIGDILWCYAILLRDCIR